MRSSAAVGRSGGYRRPRPEVVWGVAWAVAALVLVTGSGVPCSLWAQRAATTPQPVPAAAALPGIREVAADTGRMRLGWRDFSRYDWMGPGAMCEQAITQATQRVWRHAEHDTASYAAQMRDTTPPAVWAVAERCGARAAIAHAVDTVAHGARFAMFLTFLHLAVVLNRDDLVRDLLKARLAVRAQAQDSFPVNVVLEHVMDAELDLAHPPRLALVQEATALLDSLLRKPTGTWAQQYDQYALRLRGYNWIWTHWRRLGDTAQIRATIEAALAARRTEPTTLQLMYDWKGAMYQELLELAVLQHGARSQAVVQMIERMDREQNSILNTLNTVPLLRRYGQLFIWPKTPYWYAADGSPLVGPAGLPTGKVTLVVNPDDDSDHANGQMPFIGINAMKWARVITKLLTLYGPQGLQVVVLERTRGYVAGSGPLEPEQEASAIRQFYQDKLGLKAAIAIQVTPYRFKPAPDGRRVWRNTPWELRYLGPGAPVVESDAARGFYEPGWPILLDGQGRIQRFGNGSDSFGRTPEAPLLELYLQKLLRTP